MITYEIINPSDPLTCLAPSIEVAAAAIALLANGHAGVVSADGQERSPVLFGWDDWWAERGVANLGQWIEDHAADVVACLRSVMLGSVKDRADLDAMLAVIPPEAKAQWIAERNDRRRSSMNDYETAAHELAAHLAERFGVPA